MKIEHVKGVALVDQNGVIVPALVKRGEEIFYGELLVSKKEADKVIEDLIIEKRELKRKLYDAEQAKEAHLNYINR